MSAAYSTGVPGLIVRKEGRFWVVAHAQSDLRVGSIYTTKKMALNRAERFGPLADWTLPSDELKTCKSLENDIRRVW